MSSASILPSFTHSGFGHSKDLGLGSIPSLRFAFPGSNWPVADQPNNHLTNIATQNYYSSQSLASTQSHVSNAASPLLNVSYPARTQSENTFKINSQNLPTVAENFPTLTIPSPIESPILSIPKATPSLSSNIPTFPPFASSEDLEQLATDAINQAAREKVNIEGGVIKTPYEKLIHRARRVRKCRVVRGKKQRICQWCNTTVTPEWRCGPDHCMLCNACGLQYRNKLKEEQTSKKKNAVSNLLN